LMAAHIDDQADGSVRTARCWFADGFASLK